MEVVFVNPKDFSVYLEKPDFPCVEFRCRGSGDIGITEIYEVPPYSTEFHNGYISTEADVTYTLDDSIFKRIARREYIKRTHKTCELKYVVVPSSIFENMKARAKGAPNGEKEQAQS